MAVALYAFRVYKQRKREEIRQLNAKYFDTLSAYRKAFDEKQRLEANDAALIETKRMEVEQLQRQLGSLRKQLVAVSPQPSLIQLRQHNLVKAFRARAKGTILPSIPAVEQWDRLSSLFMESIAPIYAIIGQTGLLTSQELQTAMLTLLDFSNADVAVLLDVKPQRVSNLKSSVNRKLFSDASAAALKANLETLLLENGQKV